MGELANFTTRVGCDQVETDVAFNLKIKRAAERAETCKETVDLFHGRGISVEKQIACMQLSKACEALDTLVRSEGAWRKRRHEERNRAMRGKLTHIAQLGNKQGKPMKVKLHKEAQEFARLTFDTGIAHERRKNDCVLLKTKKLRNPHLQLIFALYVGACNLLGKAHGDLPAATALLVVNERQREFDMEVAARQCPSISSIRNIMKPRQKRTFRGRSVKAGKGLALFSTFHKAKNQCTTDHPNKWFCRWMMKHVHKH